MRTPHTFQIGTTTYTTREYCNARGITDNASILKIQWRINTYIRNHTNQQTIEKLKTLTSSPTHSTRVTHPAAGWLDEQRQEKYPASIDGIRPWQKTKKEREIAQEQKEAREAATRKMITQQHNGETATKAIDQRELLNKTRWMEHNQKWLNEAEILPNAEDIQKANKPHTINNAIHQYAGAIETVNRLEKELEEAQNTLDRWKEITANLLNGETSCERTKRYNTKTAETG